MPWNRLLGPVSARGPVSGVVWRAGQVLARWGEPQRVDLTFSVADVLAVVAGRHPRAERVLSVSSVLVDGVAVTRGHGVEPGVVLEVLPPFAGG